MDDNHQTSGDKSGGMVIVAVIGFVVVIALSARACHPVAGTPSAAITTPAPQTAPAQQPAQATEASQPGNILFKIGKEIHGSLTKGGQAAGGLPVEMTVDASHQTSPTFMESIDAAPVPEGVDPNAHSSFVWVRNHSGYRTHPDIDALDPRIRQACIDYYTHEFVVIDEAHHCDFASANGFESRGSSSVRVEVTFKKMTD